MSLMAGVMAAQAAKGLLDSARSLAQSVRQPKAPQADFATLLRGKIAEAGESGRAERKAAQVERLTDRAFKAGDANGDGFLDQTESGLDTNLFARMDTDGDGRLSRDEVRAQAKALVDAVYGRGGKE